MAEPRTLVVALGGNAILRRGEAGTLEQQYAHAVEAMRPVAELVRQGHRLALTHGNGTVVGNIVERGEAARSRITPMPLWIADADSQGGIGALLQMALRNVMSAEGLVREVVTLVTEVVVDSADPAFGAPSKPIGPWYSAEDARALAGAEGWTFREQPGRGWRRVVASPAPLRVVEADSIGHLMAAGHVVIAAGGGGIPVVERADGSLEGIDAVIDKDATSALLARIVDADTLVIVMEERGVQLGFGTPAQRAVERLTAEEAERLLAEGSLAEGSIAPKVAAAASFARASGRDAVICSAEELAEALDGRAGTRVTPA